MMSIKNNSRQNGSSVHRGIRNRLVDLRDKAVPSHNIFWDPFNRILQEKPVLMSVKLLVSVLKLDTVDIVSEF